MAPVAGMGRQSRGKLQQSERMEGLRSARKGLLGAKEKVPRGRGLKELLGRKGRELLSIEVVSMGRYDPTGTHKEVR